MPAIPKSEAIERLAQAAETASAADFADMYSELFPEKSYRMGLVKPVVEEVASYIRTKIEPDEIVDLWNVTFPKSWNVYYDDEDELIVYSLEQPEFADW